MSTRITTPGRFFSFWYDKQENQIIVKFDVNDSQGERLRMQCAIIWDTNSDTTTIHELNRELQPSSQKRIPSEKQEVRYVTSNNAKSVAQEIVSAWSSVMWHKQHAEICKAAMEDRENIDNFEVFKQLQNDYENHKTLANIGLTEFEEMMRPYVNRLISAEITKVQAKIRANLKSRHRDASDFGRDFV